MSDSIINEFEESYYTLIYHKSLLNLELTKLDYTKYDEEFENFLLDLKTYNDIQCVFSVQSLHIQYTTLNQKRNIMSLFHYILELNNEISDYNKDELQEAINLSESSEDVELQEAIKLSLKEQQLSDDLSKKTNHKTLTKTKTFEKKNIKKEKSILYQQPISISGQKAEERIKKMNQKYKKK